VRPARGPEAGIGSGKATEIVQLASVENLTPREAALKPGSDGGEEFDRLATPVRMDHPER